MPTLTSLLFIVYNYNIYLKLSCNSLTFFLLYTYQILLFTVHSFFCDSLKYVEEPTGQPVKNIIHENSIFHKRQNKLITNG